MCDVRAGVDQIADCFGLKQIEFAVQDGAARKFACLGLPCSSSYRRGEHCRGYMQAAVRGYLENILAGERVGCTIERRHRLVENAAVLGIDGPSSDRSPRLEMDRLPQL